MWCVREKSWIKLNRMYRMQEMDTQEMQWDQGEAKEWNELSMSCTFTASAKLRTGGCGEGLMKQGEVVECVRKICYLGDVLGCEGGAG